MNRSGVVEWRRKRRGPGGRPFRSGWVWGVTTLVVLSASAMSVVWQKVRYEGVGLRYADLSAENDRLSSDLEAEKFEFQKRARRATLLPRANELGLVDIHTDDIILVSFPDGDDRPGNPLLGGLVGEALASDQAPAGSRPGSTPESGERDGR